MAASPALPVADAYPAEREVDVVLRDGGTARVRPVRSSDEEAILDFLSGLSTEARAFRFFSGAANVRLAAKDAATVDYVDRYGVIALQAGQVVGHACFVRTGTERAEMAFAVADRLHGRGLATILLAHLVEASQAVGISTLTAVVLPNNFRMLEVLRESGLSVEVRSSAGELHVQMPASLDPEAQRRFAERDQIAAAAGVRHVLAPRSVAVVGASEKPGSIGGTIVDNLVAAGFRGAISVVHPRANRIRGVLSHRSLDVLPVPPELVVIAVPAAGVTRVARAAGEAGARALLVISAGFTETGAKGAAREAELLEVCREFGMRLVGPNVLGVLNLDPDVALNASFATQLPERGNIALMSQSGALGIACIQAVAELGLGLSSFVSIGNRADLSANDLLQYWEDDPQTDVIMLYVESFGNPRKFARVARRVGRRKPIVAVKAGRTASGARAAQSHTGALVAGSDTAVDALFRDAGVVRVDTLPELFDAASMLSRGPAPKGNRVALLTNGGGLGILCADACEAAGLDVVELSPLLSARIRRIARGAATGNPVDLLGGATPEQFERAAAAILPSGEVDALIVLAVATPGVDPEAIGQVVDRLAESSAPQPALAMVSMPLGTDHRTDWRVPRFAFPEQAARAVARAAAYGAWRTTAAIPVPAVDDADTDAGAAIIATALARGESWLSPAETWDLLDAHGIAHVPQRYAAGPAAAARAAEELRGPVALKAVAPGLVHKSDVGAVSLSLPGGPAVERRARSMRRALARRGYPDAEFVVQPMITGGVELLVGIANDPTFGPLVVCAAGGTAAELMHDTAVRLAPVTAADAAAMLQQLRVFPLLDGYRGAPRADIDSLVRLVVAVGGLAAAHPEVVELDLNPVLAGAHGAQALDARVRIDHVPEHPPAPSVHAAWP